MHNTVSVRKTQSIKLYNNLTVPQHLSSPPEHIWHPLRHDFDAQWEPLCDANHWEKALNVRLGQLGRNGRVEANALGALAAKVGLKIFT